MEQIGKRPTHPESQRLMLEILRAVLDVVQPDEPTSEEKCVKVAKSLPVKSISAASADCASQTDAYSFSELEHAPSMIPDRYYTPEQVAAYFHVAQKTLASWRSSGEGPPFYKLGRILYRGDDLLAWSASRRAGSTAAVKEKKRAKA